ncbi:MAG: GntR family transcriptional regulator [Ruminococcaceae bacterium]|nr:GntR family transcriptional regulator [Oscillospiraceae bacterium]
MITFDDFIAESGIPIYLQVIRHIKRQIAAGTVNNGDEVISRRMLSALLGVNPNTVQKAYALLEAEGLICSHSGAKSYVVLNDDTVDRIKRELLENDISAVINGMKQMGLSKSEALEYIERMWSE